MILVTGAAGFIGSHFCGLLDGMFLDYRGLDKLTYAGRMERLANGRGKVVIGDICDRRVVMNLLRDERPDAIVHFAAETHVTRSIHDPVPFMKTNVEGTFALLEETLRYWQTLRAEEREKFRFVHVSTDEVFGSLGRGEAPFTEVSAYRPSTPYAASKAASDHIVKAYHVTYGLPVITLNSTNNYGPGQHEEKLIPLVVQKALLGEEIPVHGDGSATRDWIFVKDFCEAILVALWKGVVGESYVVGARQEHSVLHVVEHICALLDDMVPRRGRHGDLIRFVENRAGNDRRYAVDPLKMEALGWKAKHEFDLRKTVRWQLNRRTREAA